MEKSLAEMNMAVQLNPINKNRLPPVLRDNQRVKDIIYLICTNSCIFDRVSVYIKAKYVLFVHESTSASKRIIFVILSCFDLFSFSIYH